MDNIITAQLKKGETSRTIPLWQYDYGMVLLPVGVELPDAYEVHFANGKNEDSVTSIGDESGVLIPDSMFLSGKNINAWVYLHSGEDDGETVYSVVIPVNDRAKPTNETPTPVQQDVITQTIAALNAAVERSETNVTHYPKVVDGYWYCWDANENTYVNTGVSATGPQGPTGNGISDVVLNQDYTLTINFTDSTPITVGPIRGEQGPIGPQGNPAYVHIRYSANEPISDIDMKDTPDQWMGVYSGFSPTAPAHYTDYMWYRIKGDSDIYITDDDEGNVTIEYVDIMEGAGVSF